MKSESGETETLSVGERFVDALLSEHARLGSERFDDELVHRILRETVTRPVTSRHLPGPETDWRTWRKVAVLVAALVGLALIVLTSLEVGRGDRQSDELQFVIRLVEPHKVASAPAEIPPPWLDAERYSAPLRFVPPVPRPGAEPTLSHGSLELITTMGPTFEQLPQTRQPIREEHIRITADHSETVSGRLVYAGNVVVEHHLFRIQAAEVSVPDPGGPQPGGPQPGGPQPGKTEDTSGPPLLANSVKVTQKYPLRTALAKNLRFDPVSGDLILSGIDFFETSGGRLSEFSPDDLLVLNGDSFSVESPSSGHSASPPFVKPVKAP